MKILPFLILVLTSLNSFGQIPEFDSNVNKSSENQSYLYKSFYPDYEFILGYTRESDRYDRKYYSVLTYNGTDWELKKWSFELDKEAKPKKSRMKSRILKHQKVIGILNDLESKGFFSLNQDSLNWAQKDMGGGVTRSQSITDGFSENFEIISQSSHRIYSAYEPELKQKFIFSDQRQRFLECLNRFLTFKKDPYK